MKTRAALIIILFFSLSLTGCQETTPIPLDTAAPSVLTTPAQNPTPKA